MNTTLNKPVPGEAAIEQWLIARIAASAGCEAAEIDPERAMEAYGLTSVAAVGLSADLEDWLGIDVEATIVWEYPSVAALAGHLAQRLQQDAARTM